LSAFDARNFSFNFFSNSHILCLHFKTNIMF